MCHVVWSTRLLLFGTFLQAAATQWLEDIFRVEQQVLSKSDQVQSKYFNAVLLAISGAVPW
ncbi:uncharacterized protein BO97DRAFT_4727 [Aspergillus homomorphus CBS 101889]|uniref:Uncharacterized protein n=1 Tax=Aspergillus homomorphus (strain CBS 101889) TaxID=1450537 RepID=A0A395IDV8_ASPHC|nr:hypothetical protein BO97DRAFT_4727 [Aspergillus homomorphus CBS 101889]RAL17343.1 hypothetical protein BO97DRAFT_4727 [Aspergillus homomorphus CBS 101889]